MQEKTEKGEFHLCEKQRKHPLFMDELTAVNMGFVHGEWILLCDIMEEYHSPNTILILIGGANYMILSQDSLVKQIAEKGDLDIATIRNVFKSTEEVIFDYLSSTTSANTKTVRVLDGLTLECSYIPEKEIHTYDDILCKSRIWVKPKITRYYNRKLNGYFSNEK